MPRPRDNVRDFPGRRQLNLSLRTAHLAGIVLLGAALLGAGEITTGAWANPAHVRELAGFGVLVKLALVAVMALCPPVALPVFWGILAFSTLLSHAPGRLRHRQLF